MKVLTQGRYFLLQFKEERRAITRKNKNPCTLQYMCPIEREKYNTMPYCIYLLPRGKGKWNIWQRLVCACLVFSYSLLGLLYVGINLFFKNSSHMWPNFILGREAATRPKRVLMYILLWMLLDEFVCYGKFT